jgi:curved DNA-binding protein CbpA
MSNLTIDFETLKYNLYEVLGIDPKSSETKIKKAFRNLILNFHPDKNNNTEEEIYYHIVTANQILTNSDVRKRYDDFLNKLQDTHDDMKSQFNKIKEEQSRSYNKDSNNKDYNKDTKDSTKDSNKNNKKEKLYTEHHSNTKDEALEAFNNKFSKLEQQHLDNYNVSNETINNNYNKLLKEREMPIDIPKEDIKSINDFNNKFESNVFNGHFNDQIIPIKEKMELSTLNINDNYTSLDIAFNNLYIDGGGINTSKFSSLDSAFKIQQINTKDFKEVNIKNAMEAYKNETNNFSKINYSKDRFDTW